MNIITRIRLNFLLCLILIPFGVSGQNDTTVYFSKTAKVVDSKSNASSYYKLTRVKGKKVDFLLTYYYLEDNKWNKSEYAKTKIFRETDSTYILTNSDLEGSVEKRFFNRTDSGFMIRDFKGSILTQEGESKLIFPLIRFGYWRRYDSYTGALVYEGTYRENQFISNKWWLNDKEYITDVTVDVVKKPEYEGGDAALLKFVGENTKYPIEARNNGITGRVIVSFIVMNDGTIKGIQIIKNAHLLLDLEALRVINSIPENKWKPAEIDGRKVNCPIMIPITFSVR